jgi:hypothetical protein
VTESYPSTFIAVSEGRLQNTIAFSMPTSSLQKKSQYGQASWEAE